MNNLITKSTAVGQVMIPAWGGKTASSGPDQLSEICVLTLLIYIIDAVEVFYVCQKHGCLNNCQKKEKATLCLCKTNIRHLSICFHRVVILEKLINMHEYELCKG